jgi:hypothetical protein
MPPLRRRSATMLEIKRPSKRAAQRRGGYCRLADRAMSHTIRDGANAYERERDLPALIRFDASTKAAESVDGVAAIVALLEGALRTERNRARAGHWTYDLNRHIALRQALLAERARLSSLMVGRK